jgi:hypothetical protein
MTALLRASFMLAVVASLAAGFVAAVQWKMSTKQ